MIYILLIQQDLQLSEEDGIAENELVMQGSFSLAIQSLLTRICSHYENSESD